MSSRIRGQEAKVSVTISDEFLSAFGLSGFLEGSFMKVRDFKSSPRMDQTEEGYLGEDADDLDQQIHGFDFSFSIDELDTKAADLMSLIAFKEEEHLAPPVITVSASYVYREPGIIPLTEVFMECILKPAERTIGGRKEYVQNSFEGKAKRRRTLRG